MAKLFSENLEIRHHPQRAVQAWQILVGLAANRKTLTYKALSELMYGRPAAGVLDEILGHVAFYCKDHRWPPLTSLIVNSETGMPGDGIPTENLPRDREEVFRFDWFDVYPPTSDELRSSFSNHA